MSPKWQPSVVVVGGKDAELHDATHEYREKVLKQKVIRIDPFRLSKKTPDSLNILDGIPSDHPSIADACSSVAHLFHPREPGTHGGDTEHFRNNSALLLTGSLLATCRNGKPPHRSINEAIEIAQGRDTYDLLTETLLTSGHGPSVQYGRILASNQGKERASTQTTLAQATSFAFDPAIRESFSDSSFDLNVINTDPVTIYLILPVHRAEYLKVTYRLWLAAVIRKRFALGPGDHRPLHIICDEAALLGDMPELRTILTVGRGYGLHLSLFYQNEEQLLECCPVDKGGTVKANTAKIYFNVNTNETARSLSDSLGSLTEVLESGGSNAGVTNQFSPQGDSGSRNRGTSSGWSFHERKLLRPEQILNDLGRNVAICLIPGVPPLWTHLRPLHGRKPRSPPSVWEAVGHLLVAAVMCVVLCQLAVWLTELLRHPPVLQALDQFQHKGVIRERQTRPARPDQDDPQGRGQGVGRAGPGSGARGR